MVRGVRLSIDRSPAATETRSRAACRGVFGCSGGSAQADTRAQHERVVKKGRELAARAKKARKQLKRAQSGFIQGLMQLRLHRFQMRKRRLEEQAVLIDLKVHFITLRYIILRSRPRSSTSRHARPPLSPRLLAPRSSDKDESVSRTQSNDAAVRTRRDASRARTSRRTLRARVSRVYLHRVCFEGSEVFSHELNEVSFATLRAATPTIFDGVCVRAFLSARRARSSTRARARGGRYRRCWTRSVEMTCHIRIWSLHN